VYVNKGLHHKEGMIKLINDVNGIILIEGSMRGIIGLIFIGIISIILCGFNNNNIESRISNLGRIILVSCILNFVYSYLLFLFKLFIFIYKIIIVYSIISGLLLMIYHSFLAMIIVDDYFSYYML
jgi:hypothetical protein